MITMFGTERIKMINTVIIYVNIELSSHNCKWGEPHINTKYIVLCVFLVCYLAQYSGLCKIVVLLTDAVTYRLCTRIQVIQLQFPAKHCLKYMHIQIFCYGYNFVWSGRIYITDTSEDEVGKKRVHL